MSPGRKNPPAGLLHGDAQVAAAAAMSAEERLDIAEAVCVKWLLMKQLLFVIVIIIVLSV
jgi:hypothetical protein